jgi:hypothetical protein
MNTFLLSQMEVHALAVEREPNARTAIKHAAACDKARQAYLRAMYGFQPIKGGNIGKVIDAALNGNVVTIQARFIKGGKPRLGTFELPVHVFHNAGKRLTQTKAFQDLVGRMIVMKVADRYKFDGYYLSNVSTVAVFGRPYVRAHVDTLSGAGS